MTTICPFYTPFRKDIEITFWLPNHSPFSQSSCPFVKDVYELNIQGDKGFVVFDGYHRIENHPPPYPEYDDKECWEAPYDVWFPQTLCMILYSTDKEKKKTTRTTYNICCTKREIIECTDVSSKDVDDDGDEMNICFFSTDKQKLYFDILPPSTKNEQTSDV